MIKMTSMPLSSAVSLLSVLTIAAVYVCVFPSSFPSASASNDSPAAYDASAEVSISHMTLLLPFNPPALPGTSIRKPVRFLLQATGGCFRWQTSHVDVLSLETGVNSKCTRGSSSSVWIVPASTSEDKRASVWVWAEHIRTGERVAECEVFVDRVHKLKVLTSTRVVNVGDAESIDLQGFDAHHNVFSTLAGLPFEWANSNEGALRKLSFAEARMEVAEIYKSMENIRLLSDRYPAKGARTGNAEISARLVAPYEHVPSVKVVFSVVEPLYLSLSSAAITPASDLQIELETRFRESHPSTTRQLRRRIPMPSPQYQWLSSDADAVFVDQYGRVSGIDIGRSIVVVQDRNFESHQKHADFRVVDAGSLIARVFDLELETMAQKLGETWQLVRGRSYRIELELLSPDRQRIFIAPNVKFGVEFVGQAVAEMQSSLGSAAQLAVKAEHSGSSTIQFSLEPVRSSYTNRVYSPKIPVTATLQVVVSDPIQVAPSEPISLPWTGVKSKPSAFAAMAIGGSGNFAWTIADEGVATVNSKTGVITATGPGSTLVSVVDAANALNTVSVPLLVSVPSSLSFHAGPVEFEVGSDISLRFDVTDSRGKAYTDCSALMLLSSFELGELTMSLVGSSACSTSCDSMSSSCFVVDVEASKSGFATVRSVMDLDESVSRRPRPVEVLIAAYDPLVITPSDAIMSTGSTIRMSWSGGPLVWQTELQATVGARTPDAVSISLPKLNLWQERTFNVTCLEIHTQNVEIRVQNPVSSSNRHPSAASAQARVRCFSPLYLSPRSVSVPIGVVKSVSLRGGHALESNVTYSSDDPSIARVNASGHIEGVNLGRTQIRANAVDSLFDAVDVSVEFEGFKVVSSLETLLVGETALLHIAGTFGELPDHDCFDHVQCNWSIHGDEAELSEAFGDNVRLVNASAQVSAAVVGRRAGVVDVTARVRVFGREFTAKKSVRVLEPLKLISPAFLLLPQGASANIETTVDHIGDMPVGYTVMDLPPSNSKSDQPVEILEHGVLRARDSTGDSVVVISTAGELSQSVSVLASVRGVSAIGMLGFNEEKSSGSVDSSLLSWPRFCGGQNLTIDIHLRDELGRVFSHVEGWHKSASLSYMSTRPHVVRVQKSPKSSSTRFSRDGVVATLELGALQEGSAVIKVWVADNPDIAPAYGRVDVASSAQCGQPINARVVLPMSFISEDVPTTEDEQRAWTHQFCSDVQNALDIPLSSIHVRNVDVCTGQVEIEFSGSGQMSAASSVVTQAIDSSSALRSGIITRSCSASALSPPSLRMYSGPPMPASASASWTLECARIPSVPEPSAAPPSSMSPLLMSSGMQVLVAIILAGILVGLVMAYDVFSLRKRAAISHPKLSSSAASPIAVGGPARMQSSLSPQHVRQVSAGPGIQSPFELRARRFRRESNSELMRSFAS